MHTLYFLETLLTYHTKNEKFLCYLFSQRFMQLFSAELLKEAVGKENRVSESEKHVHKYTWLLHAFFSWKFNWR